MKKTLFPLILLAALLAGCGGGQAAEHPSEPAVITPVPAPTSTPVPTPTPAPEPTPEPYDYAAPVPEAEGVDDAWFSDAVFIGDSRTDGLRLYSGIRGADFLSYKGLTIFGVVSDQAVIQTDAGQAGVLTKLAQGEYAKVYVSLGLNELGYNYDEGWRETYSAMVDELKELQPEADIYLQAVIPVSTEVCEATHQASYVNNGQIAVYNDIIRTIAEEQQVYFLNVSEALVDETGELPADASSDGIHFYAEGYRVWYDYLKTHTVEEE